MIIIAYYSRGVKEKSLENLYTNALSRVISIGVGEDFREKVICECFSSLFDNYSRGNAKERT